MVFEKSYAGRPVSDLPGVLLLRASYCGESRPEAEPDVAIRPSDRM